MSLDTGFLQLAMSLYMVCVTCTVYMYVLQTTAYMYMYCSTAAVVEASLMPGMYFTTRHLTGQNSKGVRTVYMYVIRFVM